MKNSSLIVDREMIHGIIGGVDFGPRLWCIVRSPSCALVWVFGQTMSINGHQSYHQPHFTLLNRNTGRQQWREYQSLRHEGKRLSRALVEHFKTLFEERFGDCFEDIASAVKQRKTLLVEGGGDPYMPDRKLGHAAYVDWRERYGKRALR